MDRIISLIRYRFFLFAGIFPYLLGQAIAFSFNKSLGQRAMVCPPMAKAINWHYFWLGFLGISLVLIGVELFNEYFDAKEGGDRIFLKESPGIPDYFFSLGIFVFILAFFIGLYLAFKTGWPVLLFSFLGFLGAYFYVGPPIKWAYRGWGELVIAFSYGPLMILGSFYLQTKRINSLPFFAFSLCGLALFCLALLNEIPDYYQDKLVGKKNLVVRLGKQKSLKLLGTGLTCLFTILAIGVVFKKIPLLSIVSFCFLPLMIKGLTRVYRNFDNPQKFLSAVNACINIYLAVAVSLGIGYLRG